MGVKLNLVGRRFGRLIVVEEVGRNEFGTFNWICICDCGKERQVRGSSLTSGSTASCGCAISDSTKKRFTKHGAIATPEYLAWENMKARCYKKSTARYENHGGRGIKVCDRWLNSFDLFLLDVGGRPSKNHSLDRYPNNDGDYDPGNVRWATIDEQNRNKRDNRVFEYNGEKMILMDWAKRLSLPYQGLRHHLKTKSFSETFFFYKNKTA